MAAPYVSQGVKRREDPPLLMGRAHFIGDLRLPGLLAVKFLRSEHAHARIVEIDARAALNLPGVEAVVTAADLATTRAIRATMSGAGYQATDWPALARGKVRFAGEPVVAVVAADAYRAEDALDAIRVTYEPLPVVADAESALAPGAPRVHDELSDNALFRTRFENGDVARALAAADIRLAETFRHARCSSSPMEPRGVMAMLDPVDGMLIVWASTQSPHLMRSGLAEALGIPESSIRVLCPSVGGGFGPKMHLYPEDIVVAELARRLKRPVRWLEDRRENLLASAQARDHVNHVEVGARRDGTIVALKSTLICDSGAYSVYPVTASLEPLTAAGILPGPYKIGALAYEAYAVATNKCPAGAYRGVGVASYTEFTGMGSGTFRLRGMRQVAGHDAATVRVEPTGEVRGFVSAASQGQGHATTFAQVLADELGVPIEAVTIVEGDTERCPYGSGSFASRSMVVSGGALVLAARRVREKITAIAAHMLEAAGPDLTIEAGTIAVRGAPGRAVTIAEVADLAHRPSGGTLPPGVDPGLEATQYYDPPPATFSNGTHVAVVDDDPETGQVANVRRAVGGDCGRSVNPMIVDGQTHGAVAQGIGNALFEDFAYDDGGQPLTTSFLDYVIPGTMEVPPIDIVHMETPPATSVTGFKGMAEGGTIGSTAAVANAVADALAPLGIEVRELPLTPDRVHRLIKEKRS